MKEPRPTVWRVLVIEDNESIGPQIVQALAGFFDAPDSAEAVLVPKFADATARLATERFDLVVLDLRDDGADPKQEDAHPAGLVLFEKIKGLRFVPVIFYTAHPNHVGNVESAFVRVVEKTLGIEALHAAVGEVMSTRLPALARWMDEVQREYLWGMISDHWPQLERTLDGISVAHLMTRRLSAVVASKLRGSESAEAKHHPLEKYIYPPFVSTQRLAGDIVSGKVAGRDSHWIVMSPSCDLIRPERVERVLLAECLLLSEADEYKKWKAGGNGDKLDKLMKDNRQGQPERFKFLPGTFFIDDRIVDYQRLVTVTLEELSSLKHLCSLDSPFAEATQAGLARYLGRLGTPDLDLDVARSRLT